jgi:UDPglucose 6-dehydrogenase
MTEPYKHRIPGSDPIDTRMIIVGYGFVGRAVHYGFQSREVIIVDPKLKNGVTLKNIKTTPEFIFVCVSTSMGDDGSIDTKIIDKVILELQHRFWYATIVVKSTVPPKWVYKNCRGRIIYNPEFLRERSANENFADPEFHIFGGPKKYTNDLQKFYEKGSNCSPCPVFHMTATEASFVKYMINAFLATKVTFFNDLYQAIEQWDKSAGREVPDFNVIVKAIGSDPRIGHSHTKVPGYDGKLGYGGSCFPKDMSAIINSEVLPFLRQVHDTNSATRVDK